MKLVMYWHWNLVDESLAELLGIAGIPLILHVEQVVRIFYNLSLFAHIKPPFDERFKVRFPTEPKTGDWSLALAEPPVIKLSVV